VIAHAKKIAQEIRELFNKYVRLARVFEKRSYLCFERDNHRVHPARNILSQIQSVIRSTSKFVFTLTCQSKQIDRSPSPSLPLVPPNTRETAALLGTARHIIEIPVRSGKIHSGKSSQKKILSHRINMVDHCQS
jgi:hypothetical protein